MRRGLMALVGTIAGTGLMIGAKLGTTAVGDPGSVAITDAGAGAGASGLPAASASTTAPATTATSSTAPTTGAPGKTTGASPTPRRTTTPTTGSGGGTPGGGSGLTNGTFTGAAATEKYGTVTVTITVSGGRLTDITQTLSGASSTSQSISNNAFPKLKQEALAAQSASIATVSGATYTSAAYKTSLQSALDKA